LIAAAKAVAIEAPALFAIASDCCLDQEHSSQLLLSYPYTWHHTQNHPMAATSTKKVSPTNKQNAN